MKTTQVSLNWCNDRRISSLSDYFINRIDLKARLQGAKVDGFEGVKKIELKINRKLKARGMSPIRLQEECADDLETRRNDQYTLFTEIIKLRAP